MTSRYLLRETEAEGYQPANHTGTVNRRLVGPGALDGKSIEVLRGTLQPGCGAEPHAHPGIEQVVYLLSGQAKATVGSESFDMAAGDCCYFPPDVDHSFSATGETAAEVLVIYSPPYAEDPSKTRRSG